MEIENLLLIYSSDEGNLKILLKKKEEEPYKGYWILPSTMLKQEDTLLKSSQDLFTDITSVKNENIIQGRMFENIKKHFNKGVIGITHVVITDKKLVDLKKESNVEWFMIDNLPKIPLEHKKIIEEITEEIKYKIKINYKDIILQLFANDFSLSELQKFYENILDEKIDKRNFRKKFIKGDLIIDTGEKIATGSGRPSVLYKFNIENMRGRRI